MANQMTISPFTSSYPTPSAREAQRMRDRYLKALLEGDERDAAEVVRQGVTAGWGPATLYLDIMAAAMVTIGDMWHHGQLSVAHEHLATMITTRQMAMLKAELPRAESTGLKAVVSAVERDGHLLGAMIFADFLTFNGWDVDLLGTGVPAEDLARIVEERKPDLVGLAATLHAGVPLTAECVEALKALPEPPKIVIGGATVVSYPDEISEIDADLAVADILQGMVAVRQMFGLEGESAPLEVILHRVGEKVKALRTAHGWSQQELADSAGLDRTYLSAVERGRQNLTLGAMKKLADALGAPITDLMTV